VIHFIDSKTRLFLTLSALALCGCLSSRSKPPPVVEAETAVRSAPIEPPHYVDREAGELSFTPEILPALPVPADVGLLSKKDLGAAPDGGARLGRLFREAYREALAREMPLLGILGMDEAHLWPEKSRLSWVQNWRASSSSFNNSWGITGLVLAVLNATGDKVFTVSGDILDMYGKSLGTGGENGVAGYGAPVTDVFFIKFTDRTLPVQAQRFDKGLVYVDVTGKSFFIAAPAPSSLIEKDEAAGFYPADHGELRQKIKVTFEKAYRGLIDRHERAIKADGPVQYLDFGGGTWLVETDEGAVSLSGLYVQHYDGGEFAAVLPVLAENEDDGETGIFSLLRDARTIAPPFSAIVNGNIRLPGAREITPHPLDEQGKKSVFLKSLALYGIPLTDSFVNIETMTLSQRFSKGVFRCSML
jgi:hypothetical protein